MFAKLESEPNNDSCHNHLPSHLASLRTKWYKKINFQTDCVRASVVLLPAEGIEQHDQAGHDAGEWSDDQWLGDTS